jgi:HK97 family phage major capsid protein
MAELERLRDYTRQLQNAQQFSIARVLAEAATEVGLRSGLEFEVCTEAARAAGKAYDGNRPFIPWRAFRASPDLNVGTAAAGGYLVATTVADAVDILRPVSAVARAGMTVLPNLKQNLAIPKVKTTTTGYWLSTEGTQATDSAMTFGQVAMSPHTAGDITEVSRQFLLQSAQADFVVRRDLLRTIGRLIDKAVLNGLGASGQPTGLLNTAGVNAQSGTSLSYTSVLDMQRVVGEANVDDPDVGAIATNAVRKVLSGRERATGSGFIWDSNVIAGMPGQVTESMPAGALVMGPWSTIALGLWGLGLQVEINPYDPTGFQKGITQFRLLVECDVAVRQAAAFVAATSVT